MGLSVKMQVRAPARSCRILSCLLDAPDNYEMELRRADWTAKVPSSKSFDLGPHAAEMPACKKKLANLTVRAVHRRGTLPAPALWHGCRIRVHRAQRSTPRRLYGPVLPTRRDRRVPCTHPQTKLEREPSRRAPTSTPQPTSRRYPQWVSNNFYSWCSAS
jgi:hypothetical protein